MVLAGAVLSLLGSLCHLPFQALRVLLEQGPSEHGSGQVLYISIWGRLIPSLEMIGKKRVIGIARLCWSSLPGKIDMGTSGGPFGPEGSWVL